MQNSRVLSIIVSFAVTLVCFAFLTLFSTLSTVNLTWVLVTVFISTFFLFYLTLEILVYRELRMIYKIFDKYTGTKNNTYDNSDISIRKMGKKLFAYADIKQKEIERLQKLENFRREFLADISHELKTPVFAAQGFIHTLLDGAKDDEKVRDRFLNKSAKSLDDLNNLIQDLIAISQIESGEIILTKERICINHLCEGIIELLENKAKKKHTQITLKSDQKYYVKVDKFRMRQVLTNLIENAIKHGKDHGNVIIELKELSNKKISIEISDDGFGIPKEHQNRIFQRFYRVDKSRSREKGGSGLGLSIVKHIVEAHNSEITVTSKEGKGTKFKFVLTQKSSSEED